MFSGLFAPMGEIACERMHLLSVNTKEGGTQNTTRRAARFMFRNYRVRTPGFVETILQDLGWKN